MKACSKQIHSFLVIGLYIFLLVSGCANSSEKTNEPASVHFMADSVIRWLSENNWEKIASKTHPQHGLRLSPYAFVDKDFDVVIPAESVAALSADPTVRTWGAYDGTGDPIELTFSEYYKQFVYDKDFAQTRSGEVDKVIQRGNTRVNIRQVYNGEQFRFVEYYVPGTEKYSGMDWASLYLVFERFENDWRLVGIVHDQWTI